VLFASWDGRPTETLLSHAGKLNRYVLAHRHGVVRRVFPEIPLPAAAEEAKGPTSAREVYEAVVTLLISRTRERAKYPILFDENCGFGFRRNIWGLKPFGILVASAASAVLGLELIGQFAAHQHVAVMSLVLEAVNVDFFLVWIVLVKPDWIRVTANAYAERLLETLDTM
jgi:hypothetical protein